MSRQARDRLLLAAAAGMLGAGFFVWWLADPGSSPFPTRSIYALWFAALGIFGGVWLSWQRPNAQDADLVPAIVFGAAGPLSMVPLVSTGDPLMMATGLTAAAFAVLPLTRQLTLWIQGREVALALWACSILAAGIAVLVGWLVARDSPSALAAATVEINAWLGLRWALLAGALVVPAAVAGGAVLTDSRASTVAQRRITAALGIAGAAAVPLATGIALAAPGWQLFALPLFAAAGMAGLLARIAIRPLAREAGTAIAQRDLVIAAAESERNRLATELHDGPLGDLALLIQRLDAKGDLEAASSARGVADALRSIGNDLQLPILDDLGLADALEWLVGRVGRRASVEIALSVDAPVRPPPEVERAIYRITQEALLNATKHGQPPISVSYRSTRTGLTLSVEDHGPGIERAAPQRSVRDGRLGLLSMTQRAEAIGARLELADLAEGGTRLRLDWAPGAA
jgi:signal transduction histidine kinase